MIAESRIDVRFPDCDSMRIVHHAVYPIWYEIGRMDYFKMCGYDYTYTRERELDPAMVNLDMSYGAPVSYPGEVLLKTRAVLCEKKKLAFRYEVFYNENERPVATAKSFHIWVSGGSSIDLEAEFPEIFAAYRAAAEPE